MVHAISYGVRFALHGRRVGCDGAVDTFGYGIAAVELFAQQVHERLVFGLQAGLLDDANSVQRSAECQAFAGVDASGRYLTGDAFQVLYGAHLFAQQVAYIGLAE